MKEKFYFKVKYGFGKTDYASVELGAHLEKAIYAWQTGGVVTLRDKMVKGDNIISIEPHFHKYTGWYETYQPQDGDDIKQIERDCPDFRGVLPYFKEKVNYLQKSGRAHEIGTNTPVEIPHLSAPPQLQIANETKK